MVINKEWLRELLKKRNSIKITNTKRPVTGLLTRFSISFYCTESAF